MQAHRPTSVPSPLPAVAAALLMLAVAGCEDVGYGSSPYRGGVPASNRAPAVAPRPAPAAPTAKIVAPSPSSRVSSKTVAAPAAVSQSKSSSRNGGGLEDLIRDIEQNDRDKARRAKEAERRKREVWLVAHDDDLAGVRARLSAMQISLLSIDAPPARDAVAKAIAETEAEIDALRKKCGDGKVGFSDASRLRLGLQNRHNALCGSFPEYRKIVDN